jgi:sigma-E factor negative regulatory protein RseC
MHLAAWMRIGERRGRCQAGIERGGRGSVKGGEDEARTIQAESHVDVCYKDVMIRESGIIERVDGRRAVVRIQKGGSCAACENRASCHIGTDRPLLVEVDNEMGAAEGDRVELSMPTASLLKLSFLVYMVPVLALVLGAILGAEWAESLGFSSTSASLLLGGSALAVSFLFLKLLDRSLRRRPEYRPSLTKILLDR